MQRIRAVELECPYCKKITFRFKDDIANQSTFSCPICNNDLMQTHVKQAIEAMIKHNESSTYFRENKVIPIE